MLFRSADSLGTVLESGSTLVDTRPAESFAEGHVPGAIGVPLGDDFPGMAGWVLPYDRPIYFVSGSEQEALDAASKWNWENADTMNAAALKTIEASNTKVHRLNADQKKAWQKAVAPVWKTLGEDVVGPEVMARLKQIAAQHSK